MRLNLEKLDNHLKKLQEIRRLAADPELMELLAEFMSSDEGFQTRQARPPEPPRPLEPARPREPVVPEPEIRSMPADGSNSRDEVSEVVKEVLGRSDHSLGIWNRKKA